jgi:hypothetical protein
MKTTPFTLIIKILLLALILQGCGQTPATLEPTIPPATATALPPTQTPLPSITPTATTLPTETATPLPSQTNTQTPTITPTAFRTPTIGELLKERIVFYLILPEKGRTDACGNITAEPIISKRFRTGDKIQDVQIALNMLFSVGVKRYGVYYNALWDSELTISKYQYIREKDYMIIDFAGYFPVHQMTACDKHAIREQVWKTFFHYGFKEKTFRVNGHYMIDQLGGH